MHELSELLLVCTHGPASIPHLRAFLYFISFIGVICQPTRPCTSSRCLGGLCAVNGSQLTEAQTNEPHATQGTTCEASAHSQYKRRKQNVTKSIRQVTGAKEDHFAGCCASNGDATNQ